MNKKNKNKRMPRRKSAEELEALAPGIFKELEEAERLLATAGSEMEAAKGILLLRQVRHDLLRKFCEGQGLIRPGETVQAAAERFYYGEY